MKTPFMFRDTRGNPFRLWSKNCGGFSLIELMVAVAISGILAVALYNLYIFQSTTHTVQEQISDMQQNARIAMDMISRDIRMAGFNPTGATFTGLVCGTSQIQIQADLNGDGDVADDNEDITYVLNTTDSSNPRVTRKNTTSGTAQVLAEYITSFTVTPITPSTTTIGATISLTARTRGKDPNHSGDGYHRITIASETTSRNIR